MLGLFGEREWATSHSKTATDKYEKCQMHLQSFQAYIKKRHQYLPIFSQEVKISSSSTENNLIHDIMDRKFSMNLIAFSKRRPSPKFCHIRVVKSPI